MTVVETVSVSTIVFGLDLRFLLGVLGLGWGLLADRLAARWPAHEPEVDAEGAVVRPAGWVRGIDWRTAVCAVVGAAALAGVGARAEGWATWELGLLLAWALVLVVLLATDLDQRLLPDALTIPLIVAAPAAVLAGFGRFLEPADLPAAAVVAIAVPAALYLVSIPFGEGAFGLGDVKFLVGFGLFAGVSRFVLGVIAGIILAGIVIAVLLLARRISLRTFVPYGPFLIIGALWALLGPA